MADRLDSLFASIDARDTEAFIGHLTEDALFRFGSAPALRGREAIRDGVNAFFASIAGSCHSLINVLGDSDTLVCEGEVSYRRHDDTEVTLPFTNVFELDGSLISRYKIYIDLNPLYA